MATTTLTMVVGECIPTHLKTPTEASEKSNNYRARKTLRGLVVFHTRFLMVMA
jgi:hypothetical protein